jgi:hypothetical protein
VVEEQLDTLTQHLLVEMIHRLVQYQQLVVEELVEGLV